MAGYVNYSYQEEVLLFGREVRPPADFTTFTYESSMADSCETRRLRKGMFMIAGGLTL